ncbi:ABC transporter permease [Nocardioides sp. CER19]|uniref:ABC transporter permease n=1 Tax=Nocardioides sp. CER19 TaxID=3038538 RepID=UPI0024487AB1|nr:ABC transporter permease [Nocardioides sp. CER19]MDH2416111.1 ABC transporter permease [Nocardioides sp. CER19]
MSGFLLRRLGMLVLTLLASSIVIYAALYLAPGTPLSALTGGRPLPEETIRVLEQKYHLDDPVLVGYWHWLNGAMHGDFGTSFVQRVPVTDLIAPRALTTAELVFYAAVLVVVFGVAIGLLGALRPGIVDSGMLISTTVLAATPSFVAATVLISVFSVRLGWFPTLGAGDGLLDQIRHLTLPAIALATSSLALVARVTRASVLEEADREHVQTAQARGLPRRLIVRRHVLRNAAIPITTVTGVTIASLVAAVAVVEQAFNIDGLGAYLVEAASSKDFAVVQAISLLLVVAFVLTSTVVDILYAALDPRVKLGSHTS